MIIALEEVISMSFNIHWFIQRIVLTWKQAQLLLELAYDAKWFVLHMRSIIEMAPLQVYYSGLLFTLESCLIRAGYLKNIPWVIMEPKVADVWSSLLPMPNRLCFHPTESLLSLHPGTKQSDYGIHQQENNVEFWKVTPVMPIWLCFHPMGSLLPLHSRIERLAYRILQQKQP